jgi:hypothetical protein
MDAPFHQIEKKERKMDAPFHQMKKEEKNGLSLDEK